MLLVEPILSVLQYIFSISNDSLGHVLAVVSPWTPAAFTFVSSSSGTFPPAEERTPPLAPRTPVAARPSLHSPQWRPHALHSFYSVHHAPLLTRCIHLGDDLCV